MNVGIVPEGRCPASRTSSRGCQGRHGEPADPAESCDAPSARNGCFHRSPVPVHAAESAADDADATGAVWHMNHHAIWTLCAPHSVRDRRIRRLVLASVRTGAPDRTSPPKSATFRCTGAPIRYGRPWYGRTRGDGTLGARRLRCGAGQVARAGHHPRRASPLGGSVTQPLEPAAFVPLRSRARAALEAAWERATASGALPRVAPIERPAIEVERPANPEHGDLSTNLAMKLARPCRIAPLRIAEALAAELNAEAGRPGSLIGGVTVAPPGFLNLRVSDTALADVLSAVLARPAAWGRVPAATPRRVNVEFVSANPTGPLHIGNARGAFVGDLLCRVLEAAGHTVTREYYFNDFGAQVRNLGASVVAIKRGEPLPEEAYRGAYVGDLAAEIPDDVWSAAQAADADPVAIVGAVVVGAGPGGDRGVAGPSRRPLRRLEERGLALPRRLGRPGDRAPGGSRRAVRGRGRALVPIHFLRRRQGPGRPQVERRLDLLRLRRRLCRREVQPRVRPPGLHLGRGPPRDGGPAPQRGRRDGLRPRRGPDDPHGLGPVRARRGRGLHVEALGRVHHAR